MSMYERDKAMDKLILEAKRKLEEAQAEVDRLTKFLEQFDKKEEK